MARWGLGGAWASALLVSACVEATSYVCDESAECVREGVAGVCMPTGYCAFPDSSCPSGMRYGERAGDMLADTCLGQGSDGGPGGPDASVPADALDHAADADEGDVDTTCGQPELCNGVDDDCDSQVDEDFPLLGEHCDGPDTDLCAEGVYTCDGVIRVCTDTTGGSAEVCNAADDDCNGSIDEAPAIIMCGPSSDTCSGGICSCGGRETCVIGLCFDGKCGGG